MTSAADAYAKKLALSRVCVYNEDNSTYFATVLEVEPLHKRLFKSPSSKSLSSSFDENASLGLSSVLVSALSSLPSSSSTSKSLPPVKKRSSSTATTTEQTHISTNGRDYEQTNTDDAIAPGDDKDSNKEKNDKQEANMFLPVCGGLENLLLGAKVENKDDAVGDDDDKGDDGYDDGYEYYNRNSNNNNNNNNNNNVNSEGKDNIAFAATVEHDTTTTAASTIVTDDCVSVDNSDTVAEEFDVRDFGLSYDVQETMTEDRWVDTFIYPYPDEFQHSFLLLLKHQSIYWNTVETDLREDSNSLSSCPENVKRLVFRANAMLASGDKLIINMFETEAFRCITSPQIKAFFADQNARESIHQISYSKILELCDNDAYCAYLRSEDFICTVWAAIIRFNDVAIGTFRLEAYPAFMLLLLMCVERLMFCVPFAINMYAGVCGYAPKIADITSLVMRDENLHYHHARGLLSSLRVRLHKSIVSEIMLFYYNSMRDVIQHLFTHDWDEVRECPLTLDQPPVLAQRDVDQPHMSLELAQRYFDHEFYRFLYENAIIDEMPKFTSDFPFPFMRVNEQEVQTNLMESASTIYATRHA